MTAPMHSYDKATIEYLEMCGVKGELLERVRRLAQEVADLKAARTAAALGLGRSK